MGKITDAAIAIIVLVLGLWVITRLGITLPDIESMFKSFFFPTSPATNTTGTIVLALMVSTNSRIREKLQKTREYFIRSIKIRQMTNIMPKFKNTKKGGDNEHK